MIAAEVMEMGSKFLEKLDEINHEIDFVRQESARLDETGPDLDALSRFNLFNTGVYDFCMEHDAFREIVADYRKIASGFNQLLDKKINYARRFVIEQDREEKKKLEQRVKEAQRHAVDEARNTVKVRQQLTAEKNAVESQLNNAECRVQNLETHLGDHKELKKTYSQITGQIAYLENAISSLENTQADYGRRLQSELGSGFKELKRQFEDSKSDIQEKKLAEILGKVADLYELLNCYDNILGEERKTQEMVADVGKRVEFYGSRQESLADEIVARVTEKIEIRKKPDESVNFAMAVSSISEPAMYNLRQLQKAAQGYFGNSYSMRLKKITELTASLPVTDTDCDIDFLREYAAALLRSYEKGDIRRALDNCNLSKKLAMGALKAVNSYVQRCIEKHDEIYAVGA
jgi:chromosome segregation ATPase